MCGNCVVRMYCIGSDGVKWMHMLMVHQVFVRYCCQYLALFIPSEQEVTHARLNPSNNVELPASVGNFQEAWARRVPVIIVSLSLPPQ